MSDTNEDKIKKLATWYRERMTQAKRNDDREFWKFKDLPKHEQDHCRKLAFAVHSGGDRLPDDHRYAFLYEALSAIEDADDLDDVTIEADTYTRELTEWLGSGNDRSGYCDEAQREGMISEDASMVDRMSMGQYMEKREVLGEVLAHLNHEAEEDEDEEEADETSAEA